MSDARARTDILAARYLDGLDKGELRIQRCSGCQAHRFYPRPICPACGSHDFEWVVASGRGIVHSFTIVHRAPTAALADRAPYVVAMIDLDEGVRMTGGIGGTNALCISIGDQVRAEFSEAATEGRVNFVKDPAP